MPTPYQPGSLLQLCSLTEVASAGATSTFYHQTHSLSSISNQGWNIHHVAGHMPRLFGDGIYFSTTQFWPGHSGNCIEAALLLAPKKHCDFPSVGNFEAFLTTNGLNRHAASAQSQIASLFLSMGLTSYSFPEDIGDDAVMNSLLGITHKTCVVLDPNIIFITRIV